MSSQRPTRQQREQVIARARGCCEYCWSQAAYSSQSFSVEHIIALNKGGQTRLDNLALSCQGCNNYKYNKVEHTDPITHELVPLYHPRLHRWSEHFVWNDDSSLVLGITPTGRATVDLLLLNRPGVINLRQVLYAIGRHPPHVPDDESVEPR